MARLRRRAPEVRRALEPGGRVPERDRVGERIAGEAGAVDDVGKLRDPALYDHWGDSVLFRRYLGTGGKVVWLGTPPLIWPRDAKTGDLSYDQVDRGAAGRLLGVDFTRSNFDTWGNTVTQAGKKWGLSGWWDASWSVDPGAVTEAFSVDDNGLAGSWVKNYGGPAGTGFVRIGGGGWSGGPAPNYAQIQAVAEYLPMPAR